MVEFRFLYGRIMVALIMILMTAGVMAQEPLGNAGRQEIVDSITSPWNSWERASISGKLKMEGLPLSPGVKIFMQCDSSVVISLRAPFMGEVGRAEIYADTILVVNKMKKTYVKEPIDSVMANYPVTLSDLQNILLGRAIIAGKGALSADNAEVVDIYPQQNGQYSMVPSADDQLDDFQYGYVIDEWFNPAALVVIPGGKTDTVVSVLYDHVRNGMDLTVVYESPDKTKGGTLELDNPEWDGSPISPVKISNKYSRLNFTDFMKSF